MLVKPKLTSEDVNEGGPLTARDGREYYMELPGVWTDSRWGSTTKTNDPAAFDKNRELAKRISAAFSDLKTAANTIWSFQVCGRTRGGARQRRRMIRQHSIKTESWPKGSARPSAISKKPIRTDRTSSWRGGCIQTRTIRDGTRKSILVVVAAAAAPMVVRCPVGRTSMLA